VCKSFFRLLYDFPPAPGLSIDFFFPGIFCPTQALKDSLSFFLRTVTSTVSCLGGDPGSEASGRQLLK